MDEKLFGYKYRLAVQSCTDYWFLEGIIDSDKHQKKIDLMFSKKIKLLICDYKDLVSLITEDAEKYRWSKIQWWYKKNSKGIVCYRPDMIDWSNIRIVKTAFTLYNILVLTDDGKIYYLRPYNYMNVYENFIRQLIIKEKITCIACGDDFYVVVTNNGEVYDWSLNSVMNCSSKKDYIKKPRKVIELSGKTIVKIVCGNRHTLALTDKGEVYGWGASNCGQLNTSKDISSPIMMNISDVTKTLDIAALKDMSAIKSSKDGLAYICGSLFEQRIKEFTICKYTNIFDICNSVMAQSPVSTNRVYTNEEFLILNDLEAAFNDHSTSDVTIEVEGKFIYVHKTILKIRCLYFKNMFRFNGFENNRNVIKCDHCKYVVYEAFLKYLYIGVINLSSLKDVLDLMILADKYCEENLERDCIRIIKTNITRSNVFFIRKIAKRYNKKELQKYCFNFIRKIRDPPVPKCPKNLHKYFDSERK